MRIFYIILHIDPVPHREIEGAAVSDELCQCIVQFMQ